MKRPAVERLDSSGDGQKDTADREGKGPNPEDEERDDAENTAN